MVSKEVTSMDALIMSVGMSLNCLVALVASLGEEVLRPPAKELGRILRVLVRFLGIFLLPLELAVTAMEEIHTELLRQKAEKQRLVQKKA